ncbi:hypothetical protein EVAR_57772_1 [Eumeta japonica]|uniref:Uncharacterized protein n=1 Tax=Eumeta variegata TaxID=151549 RepID=A0A4C1Y7X0_EUMVA|nr:hypothetical protein EVAR_57772_1 [Eumeta japonica]
MAESPPRPLADNSGQERKVSNNAAARAARHAALFHVTPAEPRRALASDPPRPARPPPPHRFIALAPRAQLFSSIPSPNRPLFWLRDRLVGVRDCLSFKGPFINTS